jgi:hypothetical protein
MGRFSQQVCGVKCYVVSTVTVSCNNDLFVVSYLCVITREINGAPQVEIDGDNGAESPRRSVPTVHSDGLGGSPVATVVMNEMTPLQRKRFAFFRQMRIFVTNLTKICESLR